MRNLTTMDKVALALLIIGDLNWGLIGLLNFNLVDTIFGVGTTLTKLIYILVGLAAVWGIYYMVRNDNRDKI